MAATGPEAKFANSAQVALNSAGDLAKMVLDSADDRSLDSGPEQRDLHPQFAADVAVGSRAGWNQQRSGRRRHQASGLVGDESCVGTQRQAVPFGDLHPTHIRRVDEPCSLGRKVDVESVAQFHRHPIPRRAHSQNLGDRRRAQVIDSGPEIIIHEYRKNVLGRCAEPLNKIELHPKSVAQIDTPGSNSPTRTFEPQRAPGNINFSIHGAINATS